MKPSPYRLPTPALISFSGGRTSGFMLHEIMDAFHGELPSNVIPVFANTGMEHEKTYRFVSDISHGWTPITVVERVKGGGFQVVKIEDADRMGKPFSDLCEDKSYLPNPVARFCTQELKIETMRAFAESQGWPTWTIAVGLRADEPRRVAKLTSAKISAEWKMKYERVAPLADAGVGIEDVANFWDEQRKRDDGIDLGFEPGSNLLGNCVGCFLKGKRKLDEIARREPTALQWWADMEAQRGAFFRTDRPSYRQIMLQAKAQPLLYSEAQDDDTLPCDCHS